MKHFLVSSRLWVTVSLTVGVIAVIWGVAVLVFPPGGMGGAAYVTAFGLTVMVTLIAVFAARSSKEWATLDTDRIQRRRKRRTTRS